LVKLLQDGFVEPFADTVDLGMIGFRFGMLNVIECEIGLVIVILRFSAIFGTAICQDVNDPHALFCKERQHPVIEQISRGDCCFGGI